MVDRQGKQKPLLMHDPVNWDETVHTQDKGRLQITLNDGSVLSVGSRSEMKIVKSDAATQQTDIDLVTGAVKANVRKVTKSGGHFQIHTKTAVIGVIGTQLLVKSESNGTTVCNVTKQTKGSNGEAEVVVTDANGAQTQKLKSGFCAFFPLAGAATVMSGGASATTIAGMTAATVVGGVVSGTVIIAGAGAAISAGTLGGLAASGAFSGGSPVSPSQ
jgi:ferric-dicitrate binding protein FerR (iron transport regulator)